MPKQKITTAAASMMLLVALAGGTNDPVHAGPSTLRRDVPSVPEAWSPEGRARYTLHAAEAWSPEGRTPAS